MRDGETAFSELLLTVRGSGTRFTAREMGGAVIINPRGFNDPLEARLARVHVYAEHREAFMAWLERVRPQVTLVHTTLRHPYLVATTGRTRAKARKRPLDWVIDDLELWADIVLEGGWPLKPHIIPWGGGSAGCVTHEVMGLISDRVWEAYEALNSWSQARPSEGKEVRSGPGTHP